MVCYGKHLLLSLEQPQGRILVGGVSEMGILSPIYGVVFVAMSALGLSHGASAQQSYNDPSGYACTGQSKSCTTYAMYRTQSSQETFATVGNLFNLTAAEVAKDSGMNLTTAALAAKTPLYIKLSCGCTNGTYRRSVTHKVVASDTYTALANNTYEGLTTYQAMEAANPAYPATGLQIGEVLDVPLRCACPSASQTANGTKLLLTYVIFPQETLGIMSGYFGNSLADLEAANNVTATTLLQVFSTFLIPLQALKALSTISFVYPTPTTPSPASPPTTSNSNSSASTSVTKDASNTPLYIGIAIGVLGMILAAVFGALLVLVTRRRGKRARSRHESQRSLKKDATLIGVQDSMNSSLETGFLADMSDVMGSDKPTVFTYEELQHATKNFSDDSRIQGSVYFGKLQGTLVAIKQMKGNMTQELKILSQVHHGNVVRLVGICANSAGNIFLVYEYAENGSLSDCLHYQVANPSSNFSRSVGLLPWTKRVQISLDVASGLEYIHNYTNPSFVHKDVKSSNILLDENFRAKVANFGMAKSANMSGGGAILTNHIVGTQGYMAPEYLEHGLVTTKADVFSFGVVLLELLSGEEAIVKQDSGGKDQALSSMVFEVLEGENQMPQLQAWMDSRLQNAYPPDIAYSVASLAKTCVDPDPALRPTMKDITHALSKMLAASLEWESTMVFTSRMSNVSIEAR